MARETFVKIAACMNRPASFGHLDPDDIVSVVFFVAEVGFDSIVTGEFFGSNDIECSYAPHVAGELADFFPAFDWADAVNFVFFSAKPGLGNGDISGFWIAPDANIGVGCLAVTNIMFFGMRIGARNASTLI